MKRRGVSNRRRRLRGAVATRAEIIYTRQRLVNHGPVKCLLTAGTRDGDEFHIDRAKFGKNCVAYELNETPTPGKIVVLLVTVCRAVRRAVSVLGGRTIGSTSDSGSDYPGSSPGLPANSSILATAILRSIRTAARIDQKLVRKHSDCRQPPSNRDTCAGWHEETQG